MKKSSDIALYLKQPYARMVFPESDGTFRAEILEFPGCLAIGDTRNEAMNTLEEVAESWLEAALAHGQHIPEPVENHEYSGRLVLRLPKSLHKKAARVANRDGVSLNQFIVSSVAQNVGERSSVLSKTFQLVAVDMSNIALFEAPPKIVRAPHPQKEWEHVPPPERVPVNA